MKQITLIRHAKVNIDNAKKINAYALQKWVKEYDVAPIHNKSLPSDATITLAKSADVVLTSSLKRAIDSASVLGLEVHEKNELFNEAAIPEVSIPYLKLKPKVWLVILRVLLILGLGKKTTLLKPPKHKQNKQPKGLLLCQKSISTLC